MKSCKRYVLDKKVCAFTVQKWCATGRFDFAFKYDNDPKFSDRQAWANSVDPDQTAPGLHCLPFRLHLFDALLYGKDVLFDF